MHIPKEKKNFNYNFKLNIKCDPIRIRMLVTLLVEELSIMERVLNYSSEQYVTDIRRITYAQYFEALQK